MPVVTVTAAPLESALLAAALTRVNTAIAEALVLPPDAVHSLFCPAVAGATGSIAVAPWPMALLHGGRRDPALMRQAVEAAAKVLVETWNCPEEQCWVQWVLTDGVSS